MLQAFRLLPPLRASLLAGVLLGMPAYAAQFSVSATPPTIDDEDIASYEAHTETDKWWVSTADSYGNPGMTVGQTFTTGSGAVLLKAITFRIDRKTQASKEYTIRVGEIAGTKFTEITSEPASQTIDSAADDYWTWTLDRPVLLSPNTVYGVDIGLHSSSSGWSTGIPYVYYTSPGTYQAGSRFRSGTEGYGVGDDTISQVSGDRIFHLDIERPLGENLEFVAGDPKDDAVEALIPSNMSATFSQNLVEGSGNIVIRNLTDNSETTVPVDDPGVSLADNVLLLETEGLLDWNKSYAIRIDSGAVQNEAGQPYKGIIDDTTWNFTTASGDPLLDAIEALSSHISGSTILSGVEIASHKETIEVNRQRLDDSATLIAGVFQLIAAYEAAEGPLFAPGSTVRSFNRNNTNPDDIGSVANENLHWVVYTAMQLVMDEVYHGETIASFEALLDGYKFESSSHFPGAVDPPTEPDQTHRVKINASFPKTFGRDTLQWNLPARKPTGCYLAPGSVVTVEVPPSLVGQGYLVRVGAHSWDLSGRWSVKRLERATITYPIEAGKTRIASPYGGGIYIEVPAGADAGVVGVAITGAVRSPYFSLKHFHTTTDAEWLATERNHPAPWADFQTEKFMMQVPTSWIYNLDDPTTLMQDWDHAMDAMNDLMGFPRLRGKETLYPQVDVILRSSVHAPGYPSVNQTYDPAYSYNGYHGGHLVRGPQTGWHIEYHEQGHAYRFPKFGGETESNVNLLHVAVWHRKFDYSLDDAFRGSINYGNFNNVTEAPLDNTAVLWMTSFNFSPRDAPMGSWEKSYQPQGHAKFVDVARLFGWEGLDAFWYSMNLDQMNGDPVPASDDAKLLRLCQTVGKDIRPLFHFWGIHPGDPQALAAAVESEGLPPSAAIYRLLQHYKNLLPPDNTAYQNWCLDWYGKEPSINGYGVEREHARQWDTTDYSTDGGWTQERPNGGIYTEESATDIEARVQEIIDLYFDDYTVWAADFTESDLDQDDQDLDGDGLLNNEERLFGLDPTDPASSNPISVPLDNSGRFSYTRRDDALTGHRYEIWTSPDLESWSRDEAAVQSDGIPDANGVETVEVSIDPELMKSPRLFIQVRAVE